jgi:Redoxin
MLTISQFAKFFFTFMLTGVFSLTSRHAIPFVARSGGVYQGNPVKTLTMSASAAAAASVTKEVAVGDLLPAVKLTELTADSPDGRPVPIDLKELCQGKKVAIFGVPGAFTPGCSKSHLPSFMTAQSDLKSKGVDMTICVATNDAFVMEVKY